MTQVEMDHIVLNVEDMESMLHFYVEVMQFTPERLDLFRRGEVPFPSVRLNPGTIIDFFPWQMWFKGGGGSQRQRLALNHFCIALPRTQWDALRSRLDRAGVDLEDGPVKRWGAHGTGISIYFRDPEANLLEARYYEKDEDEENCLLGS